VRKSLILVWAVLFALAGCDDGNDGNDAGLATDAGGATDSGTTPTDSGMVDEDGGATGCTVTPGAAWDAPSFETNAATALALRMQLDTLVGDATMRGAESGDVTVDDVTDLTGPFGAGDPSVEDVTTTFYAGITADVFEEFVELIGVGELDLVDGDGAWAPGAAGGIFGSSRRGINEGGLEVRQLADKGLFGGAALYNYALTLTEGDLDQATIESLGALWGTNQALDFDTRTDSADYSGDMGYHAPTVQELVAAHAYAADDACAAERDEAIVAFFRTWELSLFARFVYYANAGSTGIAAATNDDDVAGALQALAEGIGLGLGFRGVDSPASGPLAGAGRVTTDAQIDAMMTSLGVDTADLGASTTGEFVSDPTSFSDAVVEVEAEVGTAFGLDSAAVEAWRDPTAG